MVRTRSKGRKWALRACGSALFDAICDSVAAGIADFEGSEAVPSWDSWVRALETVPGQSTELFRAWVGIKANFPSSMSTMPMSFSIFFHFLRLDESRGFKIIVEMLEAVWGRALVRCATSLGRADGDRIFQELSTRQNLVFRPFNKDGGDWYFPHTLEMMLPRAAFCDFIRLPDRIFKDAYDILTSEAMCSMLLMFLVKYINTPIYRSAHQQALGNLGQGLSWISVFKPPALELADGL